MRKIPITKPIFDEEESSAVIKTLESGWVVQGPNVKKFEEMFSNFTGAKYSIATTSCTTALHLSLISCGIKEGDEVILPSFTYISTANVIEYTGAKPVFCDIDINTFNIDIEQIESKITKKTKAIIPVHLFGLCAEMEEIMNIAKKYNLSVIEDSACAVGSYIKDKHAGTFGEAGCFSFHPRKAITTGEGGMITTNNAQISKKCRILRDNGAEKSDLQRHKKGGSLLPEFNCLGYNYRMTDIQGALGVAQMNKLEYILNNRKKKAYNYFKILNDIDWLKLPSEPNGYTHSYQSFVCLLQPYEINIKNLTKLNLLRNNLMMKLEEAGISVRQGTHAVHTLGFYRKKYNIEEKSYPNSLFADRLSITLPLYATMSEDEQIYICEIIKKIFREKI